MMKSNIKTGNINSYYQCGKCLTLLNRRLTAHLTSPGRRYSKRIISNVATEQMFSSMSRSSGTFIPSAHLCVYTISESGSCTLAGDISNISVEQYNMPLVHHLLYISCQEACSLPALISTLCLTLISSGGGGNSHDKPAMAISLMSWQLWRNGWRRLYNNGMDIKQQGTSRNGIGMANGNNGKCHTHLTMLFTGCRRNTASWRVGFSSLF